MADLLALQPNLNIRLFLVAPDERRSKVEQEIRRPAFSLRERPLNALCGFIPFNRLTERITVIRENNLATSLNPDFLSKSVAEYFKREDTTTS
ncbi:hypothetical protein JQX13_20245 [Archangium violaceum]|uniref:hypothetical protein n=1 Tax=Archangium violaceum TaxID=83451 RepID=UPI00193B1A2A|nr:hypothetical protein [Archangium violaceum]QRK12163.1 hypothetical protein JQX13_20245 [Archangium violaceum]